MYNLNHDYSRHYDALYEREHGNDSREESIKECDDCDGHGNYSSCCGAPIGMNNICTDCEDICDEVICPTCKGDGVVDI